ncbi:hypothetical protein LSTR_LSTR014349 [Laodelphax striatellus]|uniref:Uncharacterized protein n=1 Tax=Laodelphax striatellus TaxID=195883 RepID=A0A482WSK4_LAOST|nr:hypothetical protein LSTR_LSTR014349 [Laodelphax striatellus]
MVFCSKPSSTLLIIIVITTIISKPIGSEICCTPNVRTALFSADDLDVETCWTTDNVSLLFSRYLLQTILPKHFPKNVESLSLFVYLCFGEVNSLVINNLAHRLMVKSMSDTLGGYQQGYGLPISYQLYYEDNKDAALVTVLKMISEQHEMQRILGTNGGSWVEPLVIHDVISNVDDLKIECSANINYCNKIELAEDKFTKNIPLPIVDDVNQPHALALPLKDTKLHSLFNCSSEKVLHTYYKTALCCLRKGCVDDIEYFQNKFKLWLKKYVVSHLNDGTFYPAYKGVFRLIKSVQNKNIEFEIVNIKENTVLMRFQKAITSKKSIKLMKNIAIGVAAVVVITAVYPWLKFLVQCLYEKWRKTKEQEPEKKKTKENLDKLEEGRRLEDSKEMYERVKSLSEELIRMDQRRTLGSQASESRKLSNLDSFRWFGGSKMEGDNSDVLNSQEESVKSNLPKPRDSDSNSRDKSESLVEPRKFFESNSREESLGSKQGEKDLSEINNDDVMGSRNTDEPSVISGRETSLKPSILTTQDLSKPSIRKTSSGIITDESSRVGAKPATSTTKNSSNPKKKSCPTLKSILPSRKSSKLDRKDSLDMYEDSPMYRKMSDRSYKTDPKKRSSSQLQQLLSSMNPRKRSTDSKLEHKDSLEMYNEINNSMTEKSLDDLRRAQGSLQMKPNSNVVDSKIESIKRHDSLERPVTAERDSSLVPRYFSLTQGSERPSILDPDRDISPSLNRLSKRVTIQEPDLDSVSQKSRKVSYIDEYLDDEDSDESPDYRGDESPDFRGDESPDYKRDESPDSRGDESPDSRGDESPDYRGEDFKDTHLGHTSSDKSLLNYKSYESLYDEDEDPNRKTDDVTDTNPVSHNRNGTISSDISSVNKPQTAIRMGNNENNVDGKNIDGNNVDGNDIDGRNDDGNNKDSNNVDGKGQLAQDKDESNKMGYFY